MIDLKRVRREAAITYAFGHAKPPLRVAQGEWFVLEASKRLTHGHANPFAGSIYVEGAEPGDTQVVDVDDLGSESIGFVATEGNMGPPLYGTRYPELQHHFTQMIAPMIGVCPPARPEQGNETLTMQTSHGGNLDSTDVEKAIGSTAHQRGRGRGCALL